MRNACFFVFAILCLAVLCAGCCRQEYAGVLVFNDADKPVTVTLIGDQDQDQVWVLEPGEDYIVPALAGTATLKLLKEGDTRSITRILELRLEDLALISTDASKCLIMADYTRQYGGDGQVQVLARTGPGSVGRIPLLVFHNTTYYGPQHKLPPDIRDDETLIRFTHAPCGLMKKDADLKSFLYKLD